MQKSNGLKPCPNQPFLKPERHVPGLASQPREGTSLGETQAVTLQRIDGRSRERCCLLGSATGTGPSGRPGPPGSRGSHFLNDVQ